MSPRQEICCGICGAPNRLPAARRPLLCHRCLSPLSARIPFSVQKTLALTAAGLILFFPANLLPVMTVTITGDVQELTVWGGVMELYHSDLHVIAGIVFLASLVTPFLKLAGMLYLVVTVRTGRNTREKMRVHRLIKTIGIWSMVDIFLLSILVAVGQLGILASVEPGPGAVAFCVVVLVTLFAAETFDTRLLWDNDRSNLNRHA